jgi:PD-(D/E)XK nuclease superfamily protein
MFYLDWGWADELSSLRSWERNRGMSRAGASSLKNQRPKIIQDNKRRGEWAEAVFAARAGENGLPVSRPLGEAGSFDCVVGRPGKFVAVQVKCTMAKLPNSNGYICSVSHNNQRYRAGAFDFLAAYVIPEDTWYILPAEVIQGLRSICLCSGRAGKYEEYREAWHLLQEASGCGAERAEEFGSEPEEVLLSAARMHGAFHSFRNYLARVGG